MNHVFSKNIITILKSEAFIFFLATVWIYYLIGASWWVFLSLILLPDIFMFGYIKNSKFGAIIYNIGHTYITPLLFLGLYFIFHLSILLPISVVWIAHISMDRMFGFGLKLNTNFKHTHLGEIGAKKQHEKEY